MPAVHPPIQGEVRWVQHLQRFFWALLLFSVLAPVSSDVKSLAQVIPGACAIPERGRRRGFLSASCFPDGGCSHISLLLAPSGPAG